MAHRYMNTLAVTARSVQISDAMKSMFDSGQYSDLEVHCQHKEFKLHRVVVCPQSDFFQKACDSGFKEAVEGVIEMHDYHPGILSAVFKYMYNGMLRTTDRVLRDFEHWDIQEGHYLPKEESAEPSTVISAHMHYRFLVGVYACADKLMMEPLKESALKAFSDRLKYFRPLLTTRHEVSWSALVDSIYSSTPDSARGLRDLVVETAAIHAIEGGDDLPTEASLSERNDLAETHWSTSLKSNPDFAADLARKVIDIARTERHRPAKRSRRS